MSRRTSRRSSLGLLSVGLLLSVGFGACGGEVSPPAPPRVGAQSGLPTTERADGAAPLVASSTTPARRAPPRDVDSLPLVPRPRRATTCEGEFDVARATIAADADPEVRRVAERLANWLGLAHDPASGPAVVARRAGDALPSSGILLRLEADAGSDSRPPRAPANAAEEAPRTPADEAYVLDVDERRVVVRAKTVAGLFYGAQTLAQLADARPLLGSSSTSAPARAPTSPKPIPCIHIEDAPRFAFRAMHLDVARHFFSREVVERYVDLLSFYRFNVFHWHLTDDQGFRIAISSHPELTDVGARRIEDGVEIGGFYSQDDARRVVAHAAERFITVVPEVEMPGHARAVLASHPELSCTGAPLRVPSTWGVFDDVFCAGNDRTYALLDDVLREIVDVFPSRAIHIGGDEVPKHRWESCPKCRARMKAEKVSAEGLQGWFMAKIAKNLAARGRRPMTWDEALDGGLPKSGVVVAWQGVERGALAARAGWDVVMAPHPFMYFDKRQSVTAEPGHSEYLSWSKILGFDPLPPKLSPTEAAHVIGGEGALWTEHLRTPEDIDRMAMPRLAALAEVLWSTPLTSSSEAGEPASESAKRREASFASRFTAQRAMLDRAKLGYFVEPPEGLRAKSVFLDQATISLAPPALYRDGVVRFTLDGSEPTDASPAFRAPIVVDGTTRVATRLFLDGGKTSPVVRGTFERVTLSPAMPTPDRGVREGVKYTYFEGDFEHVPDFRMLAGKARRSGIRADVGLESSFRKEKFAVAFEALIDVPESGIHRFTARSDDGVVLDVDGIRVFEDDGSHAAREVDGDVALAKGLHTVRLGYFQGKGGKEVSLRCAGPGTNPGPCRLLVAR